MPEITELNSDWIAEFPYLEEQTAVIDVFRKVFKQKQDRGKTLERALDLSCEDWAIAKREKNGVILTSDSCLKAYNNLFLGKPHEFLKIKLDRVLEKNRVLKDKFLQYCKDNKLCKKLLFLSDFVSNVNDIARLHFKCKQPPSFTLGDSCKLVITSNISDDTIGFEPLDKNNLLTIGAVIHDLMSSGKLKPGDLYVELGSGTGAGCFVANFFGLRARGYEINHELIKMSNIALDDLIEIGIIKGDVEFKEASYYPASYLGVRKRGNSVAKKFDNGRKDYLFLESEVQATIPELKQGKLFFAYTWHSQTPSVLELFSRYADNKSFLYNISPSFNEHGLPGSRRDFKSCVRALKLSRRNIKYGANVFYKNRRKR